MNIGFISNMSDYCFECGHLGNVSKNCKEEEVVDEKYGPHIKAFGFRD